MGNSQKFRTNLYEFRTNFVRIYPPFHSFALLQLPKPSRSSLLTMSQQTMSQLASLSSRPDPAADTLAHYQALPVAHHQLEEATYESEALGADDIVGWAASLDPSPDVIHIDMRSPTRNSYLGGRGWATTPCGGNYAIYRTITSDRRVPDYGLHGVLRVLLCAVNGTRDLVVQLTGKAAATVARTMLQPVLDEARLAARTCTRASLNNDKANSKGKVRMECAAPIHFMRNRGWEKIIDACLAQPSVRQHQVGGKSWVRCAKRAGRILQACVYTRGVPHGSPGPTWGGSGTIA